MEHMLVYGLNGLRGVLESDPAEAGGEGRVGVRLDSGDRIVVPRNLLTQRADGSYDLAVHGADLAQFSDLVVPRAEERLQVGKHRVETGKVVVRKTVREREKTVDEPLIEERVEVERVPVNRVVEQPIGIRQEGDVTIIPVFEEVLVVNKKLLLKEEVRITRSRSERHDPQTVRLREEHIEVARSGAGGAPKPSNHRASIVDSGTQSPTHQ